MRAAHSAQSTAQKPRLRPYSKIQSKNTDKAGGVETRKLRCGSCFSHYRYTQTTLNAEQQDDLTANIFTLCHPMKTLGSSWCSRAKCWKYEKGWQCSMHVANYLLRKATSSQAGAMWKKKVDARNHPRWSAGNEDGAFKTNPAQGLLHLPYKRKA